RARAAERKTAAPALLKVSRDLIRSEDYSEAISIAKSVLDYDSKNAAAQIQIAMAQWLGEGRPKNGNRFAQLAETMSDSNLTPTLAAISTNLASPENHQKQLSDDFSQLGYPEIGAHFLRDQNARLTAYRESLQKAYAERGEPLAHFRISTQPDHPLHFSSDSNQHSVTSIEPLAGIPFTAISLAAPVSDLSPLRNMTTLRELTLGAQVKAESLEPLVGLPIERLSFSYCESISDISPLTKLTTLRELRLSPKDLEQLKYIKDLKLESLMIDEVNGTSGTLDFAYLEGMPLKKLSIPTNHGNAKSKEILRTFALEHLELKSEKPFSTKHIPTDNLKHLRLHGTGPDTLAPLKGLTLNHLAVTGTRSIDGVQLLETIATESLEQHEIYGTHHFPNGCLPPMAELKRMRIHGGIPRFFPEPRHFPALEEITTDQIAPRLILTPSLFLALIYDSEPLAKAELNRVCRIIDTHPAYSKLGHWKPYLETCISQFFRDRSGPFGDTLIDSTTHDQHRYALVNVPGKIGAGYAELASFVGADLASVTTAAKHTSLNSQLILPNRDFFIRINRRNVLIGGTIHGENLRWPNGENSDFRIWLDPNRTNARLDGNVITMKMSLEAWDSPANGKWSAAPPLSVYPAILEWKTDKLDEALALIPDKFAQ
ncbi:MAG: hypothetical protein AAF226_04525, partial [Verrucomicrobiota bacterium]